MKVLQFVMVFILSGVIAFLVARYENPDSQSKNVSAAPDEVYDRIQKTGLIHCGYSSWKPLFYIDPTDGEKKGIFHDLMEEAAARLNLKVVWQEELGWGSVTESVKSGRVDMACSGYYTSAPRIKDLSSTIAQLYTPLYVYVRQNETRHFDKLDDLNSDHLIVARIDGSGENAAVVGHFPLAKSLALPELSTSADEIQSLLTHKVDFIVLDMATAASYQEANPNMIKEILPNQSVVEFPNVMLLPPKELRLKEMMDAMLQNLDYDGTIDKILKTYHAENDFLRNPPPIVLPTQ